MNGALSVGRSLTGSCVVMVSPWIPTSLCLSFCSWICFEVILMCYVVVFVDLVQEHQANASSPRTCGAAR